MTPAQESALIPVRDGGLMTRTEFIQVAESALVDLGSEHEEQTGIADNELHPAEYWMEELLNAIHNR